jgi:hypothetical protein
MTCKGCDLPTRDWFGDPWCDTCHGVIVESGGGIKKLFRHVANVRGPELGIPVVWDESAQHYLVRFPNKTNPAAGGGLVDEEFRRTPILSSFGSLDVVLTQALNEVRVEGGPIPEVSGAPSSTLEERALLGV